MRGANVKTKITQHESESPASDPDPAPRSTSPAAQPRGGGRTVAIVVGVLLALLGLVAAAGGGALVYVDSAKTDGDGYYTGAPHAFASSGNALVTGNLEIQRSDAGFLLSSGHLAKIRLAARSNADKPLFLGVAPAQAIADYLDDVPRDEISDVDFDPFGVTYTPHAGGSTPAPPAELDIWAARS